MWREGVTQAGEGTNEKCIEIFIHPVFRLLALHPLELLRDAM